MSFDSSSYPYDTVVYITDTIGDQSFQASGVLISPDEVLTASHVVYNSDLGVALDITVAPAYNAGAEPFGTATGTYIHYFQVQDGNDLISAQQSQIDYAVIHLSRPFTGLGVMGLEPNFQGGDVNVTGYPAGLNGVMENNQQPVTVDPVYLLLDGTGIGRGSSGGPVWNFGSNGEPYVFGLVSSSAGGVGSTGYFTQITTSVFNQIESWVNQDDSSTGAQNEALSVFDTTLNIALAAAVQPYTGPVAGLQNQYINTAGDNLNIDVGTPDWFLHSGGGEDALTVSGGTNVLDGGTGSNFLTGGAGTDTFFVDDRNPSADIWSTVNDFHKGDAATIWGITQQQFNLGWVDGQGATGYTGLTLHAFAAGLPTASLTLSGYSTSDLNNGRLAVSFGTDPASGSPYMYVYAKS
jgi:V8-like Glu-specific endopeptidase